jgi:fucose permease
LNKRIVTQVDRAAHTSLFVYAASALALPICLVQMSADLNFNLTQAGTLGFILSMEQFVVLILSVFMAARFGKIRLLRLAMLVLAVGLFAFNLSRSYLMAVALILLIGAGNGFLEALLSPLIEDVHPDDDGKYQNKLHSYWPLGVLVSTLIIGEFLSWGGSWRTVFIGLSLLVVTGSFFYPSSKKAALPRSRADFSHMREILSQPKFWLLGMCLFFAGGAEGAFNFWTASYIQLHFGALPRAGGIGTAFFALGMAVGRILTSRIASKIGLKRVIQISALFSLLVSLTFFMISNLWILYLFMLVIGITTACFWPSLQTYAARVIPVDTTLLMIFMSCLGIPGYSSATLLIGFIGDRWGLKSGFIVPPAYLLILLILISLEKMIKIQPKIRSKIIIDNIK